MELEQEQPEISHLMMKLNPLSQRDKNHKSPVRLQNTTS